MEILVCFVSTSIWAIEFDLNANLAWFDAKMMNWSDFKLLNLLETISPIKLHRSIQQKLAEVSFEWFFFSIRVDLRLKSSQRKNKWFYVRWSFPNFWLQAEAELHWAEDEKIFHRFPSFFSSSWIGIQIHSLIEWRRKYEARSHLSAQYFFQ